MNTKNIHILLADDDIDDCGFFKVALSKLPLLTSLKTVYDGIQLMKYLKAHIDELPDVLFLDLNMPCKNGFECLEEIQQNEKMKSLPVIIFSTSFNQSRVDILYQSGAQYFMRKPAEFSQLGEIIYKGLTRIMQHLSADNDKKMQPAKEDFVIV